MHRPFRRPLALQTRGRMRRLSIERLEFRAMLASDTSAGTGLLAQYYDQLDLSALVMTRIDPGIQFNWGTSAPTASMGPDTFSVRWSGQVEAVYTELYSFFVNADDGVRLWIDGQLIVDRWNATPVINASGTIALIAGRKYDLQLEYFENTGSASVSLEWSSASQSRTIIPTSRLFPAERGSLLQETWTGVSGTSIAALTSLANFPNTPTTSASLTSFEAPSNAGENYGQRIRGYLHAPTTGDYTFYLSADETAELWLSNSADINNKQRIASVPSSTQPREWNQFSSQHSSVVKLVAGQTYYIEALHKESTGADHLAVGWLRPTQSSIEVIDGQYLSPVLPTVSLYSETPSAGEGTGGPGRVTVVRSGSSNTNPLSVAYTLRGSATNGIDYNTLSGTVVIPAGQSSANIDFSAINDGLTEGTETALIELVDATGYEVDRISQRSASVTIQDNANAPAGGTSIIAGASLSNFTSFGGNFSTVTDPTYGNVIQATITTAQSSPWDSQLRQSINGPIKLGDLLFFEFYVRSVGGSGTASAIFEMNGAPYTKSLDQGVLATTTWTRVQLPFVSAADYAAGQAAIAFHLGAKAQTLQFFGFQLLNYGPSLKLEPPTISLQNLGGNYGTMQTVPVTGQSFTSAYQIDTLSTPANSENWRLQGIVRNSASVRSGDVLQYEFWARGVSGTSPRIGVAVQESYGSFITLNYNQINLTNGWQKYTFNVTTTKDYAKDTLQITFNVGFAPQSVQIGAFTWRNTTRGILFESLPNRTAATTYLGRSGTDSWRADAEARIQQSRMGALTVQVIDTNGAAIDGAVVQLRQKEQAFRFGSAVSGYDNLLSSSGTPEALRYQSEIKRLFNTVVIENNLKWPDFANNRQLGIDAANWAITNGLYLRGHNIVWPSRTFMPSSVWSQYDSLLASQGSTAAANYLRTTVRARISDAANTFKGIASEWDVVNEPFANHDVMDILGDDELLEWFRLYRTIDPTGKRVLNDYDIFARNGGNTSHRENFDYWLGRLTAQDLIEVIGEQSHYSESNLTDMAVLGQLLNSYHTTYDLPIAITEFDVNSKNEQLQADYLRDYMTMAFSQPGVSEFLYWGFWSKSHWLPDAALYRDDFSIKPNGQAYEDLVFGDWWTSTRGTTRDGQLQSKVFTGEFDIVVTWNGQTVSTTATVDTTGNIVNVVVPANEAPTITANQSSVSGPLSTPITNSGTWSDQENGSVVLSASLGAVTQNANGTWSWTYTPTALATNQQVTITANDGISISSVSFTYNVIAATIATRSIFYNNATGSNLSSAGAANNAIATDKSPLLPGQSSTFANYTNYSRGLNGVIVDIHHLPPTTTDSQLLSSLQFAHWNGISAGGFSSLPAAAIPTVAILGGAGISGSARVKITFPDNTLQNTWLRVTVPANNTTGLQANDVLYFGNVIGDVDIGNTATRLPVDAQDTSMIRAHQSALPNSAGVTNIYDVNRDGSVDAQDTSIVRGNQRALGIVAPLTAPSQSPPLPPMNGESVPTPPVVLSATTASLSNTHSGFQQEYLSRSLQSDKFYQNSAMLPLPWFGVPFESSSWTDPIRKKSEVKSGLAIRETTDNFFADLGKSPLPWSEM